MTDKFLEWIAYNNLVDQLFSGLGLTVLVTVMAGWVILRSSVRLFKLFLKITLGLSIIGFLAWYWQLF